MKILKKHKYKLLTLMLSIVSIFTLLLGINKTYAYETDNFSYTLTINNTIETYGNYQGVKIDNLSFKVNENISNANDYYMLINYVILNSTTNELYALNNNSNMYNGFTYNINIGSNYPFYFYNNKLFDNQQTLIQTIKTNASAYFVTTNNYSFVLSSYSGTMTSAYYILVLNIDIVKPTDIGLQQYYETYYGQIEDNYNALLSDYNDLQDNYDTLEVQYGDLQDDYEELETNYDTLQENYSNLEDKTSYGIFGYLQDANFQYDIQNTPQITIDNKTNFVLSDLQQLGIISSGGNYNAYYFETNYNPNYYGVIGNFYFNSSLPLTLIDLTFKDMDGALVEIVDDEGGTARFNITSSLQTINYNNILKLSASFTNFVDEIHIKPNNAELMGSMLTSSGYNVGYLYGTQIGFKNGRDSLQSTVDSLNNQVNQLNNQISSLTRTNRLLQEQIASINNDYNLNNLMWTIASTPFESFKQIWNVNFLGVNISQMVTGIITAFIAIYIVKKFFL